MAIHMKCVHCGARITTTSVVEAVKWDASHDEVCPALAEGDSGKLTSNGLEHRPDSDFDIATHRPLAPEGDSNE